MKYFKFLKTILTLTLTTLCLIALIQIYPNQSFAQTPLCISSGNNQGLISGLNYQTGSAKLGNTDTTCVFDPQAAYRDFKVPTYNDLENSFYSLSRSTAKRSTTLPNGDLVFSSDGIYLQTNDMAISSAIGSGVQVIFIRGNLNIVGNLNYAPSDPYSGLVFIASGDINIYSTVTRVNAILISSGIICTAYDTTQTPPCINSSSFTTQTPQLTVNGSLISLNKTNLANGTSAIKMVRNLATNSQAAEIINKQDKFLYILRNGILTKDLIITQEDSSYSIVPNPNPPGPPPAPPATCQGTNPLAVLSSPVPTVAPCVIGI